MLVWIVRRLALTLGVAAAAISLTAVSAGAVMLIVYLISLAAP